MIPSAMFDIPGPAPDTSPRLAGRSEPPGAKHAARTQRTIGDAPLRSYFEPDLVAMKTRGLGGPGE